MGITEHSSRYNETGISYFCQAFGQWRVYLALKHRSGGPRFAFSEAKPWSAHYSVTAWYVADIDSKSNRTHVATTGHSASYHVTLRRISIDVHQVLLRCAADVLYPKLIQLLYKINPDSSFTTQPTGKGSYIDRATVISIGV